MHHDTNGDAPTRPELVAWIGDWMGRELDLRGAPVTPERPFVAYGMDSIHATMLVGDLEEHLGRRLTPTLTWDHPTVGALADYLAPAAAVAPAAADPRALLARVDELSDAAVDALLAARLPNASAHNAQAPNASMPNAPRPNVPPPNGVAGGVPLGAAASRA